MSERYVMRPAESGGQREYEIFDNAERRTIASFRESKGEIRTRQIARGDPDPHTLALEFVTRLNADDQQLRQATDARQQIGEHLDDLPSADVIQMAEALAGGGALRVVVRR